MSDISPPLDSPANEGSPFAPDQPTWFHRVESVLEAGSEYLNPILVKETRQALKSRQFVVTFILLLFCGWGWSLFWVAMTYPGIYYSPQGPVMLTGYYWVLSFPLIVIVPFAAFRSLSGEREDGTYELVSITALRPRQIIGGKLGSAVMQSLIYLSALSPGMAFTYMLRGVDIVLILMICLYLFLASQLLSVVGLVLATVTTSRHWQMVLGVIFILGLIVVFLYSGGGVSFGILEGSGLPYDQVHFWVAQLVILSEYAGVFALLFLSAMARVTFASDNRSTKLRVAMLGLHLLAVGWVMWYWLVLEAQDALYGALIFAGLFWFAMGILMVGESPELSPRTRRQLPSSYLGRMFFTWFNPGPGTGFMFAAINMIALLLAIFAAAMLSSVVGFPGRPDEEHVLFALFVFCYVVNYVGLTRLIMLALDRVLYVNIFLSGLIGVFMLLLGVFVPLIVQMFLYGVLGMRFDYTAMQIPNPFWTLVAIVEGDLTNILGPAMYLEALLLVVSSGLMLLVNFFISAREVTQQREAAPQRVQQEEQLLHPEKTAKPAQTSPWDTAPSTSGGNGERGP